MTRKIERVLRTDPIPAKPTAILCNELMSRDFTDGAYALRDALADRNELEDEHESVAAILKCVERLRAVNGEQARGAIAALAHYAVICANGGIPDLGSWTPLDVIYFDEDGDDRNPHPLSRYFDVAGDPISMTPDLVAHRWTAHPIVPAQHISTELVRAIGKPISRKRFDAMRAALSA